LPLSPAASTILAVANKARITRQVVISFLSIFHFLFSGRRHNCMGALYGIALLAAAVNKSTGKVSQNRYVKMK